MIERLKRELSKKTNKQRIKTIYTALIYKYKLAKAKKIVSFACLLM